MPVRSEVSFRVGLDQIILVKADVEGDRILSISGVRAEDFDSETISFQLSDWSKDGKTLFTLTARNQLSRPIKVDLRMPIPGQSAPIYTSSCPMRPDIWLFESWPHPVDVLEISNVRFAEGDDLTTCQ